VSVRTARIADIPAHPAPVEGLTWHPVRHHLGVTGFGVNAYSAREDGELVVEPHDEDEMEELYCVVAGAARFVVDGTPIDAPAGTVVLVTPPSFRQAHATAPGTVVLVVGAVPGRAFAVSEWETRWRGE
jgi:mannose-6-phosphate isomerase-like protein (cupin superfamily)